MKLIINADDFGLADCVNKGIIEAYLNGVLTSATLMTNTENAANAVTAAKKYSIPLGIHLNLNYGRPLTALNYCKTLVDIQTGNFYKSAYDVINKIKSGNIKLSDIESEYYNQFAFAADHKLKLTHIDSHKHLHHFMPVYRIIEKLARKFNIKKIRIAAEYDFQYFIDKFARFGDNDFTFQLYISHSKKNGSYKSEWFDNPYNFAGFFYAGKMSNEKFDEIIKQIKDSDAPVEIMCHPAYNKSELSEISTLTHHRETELETLKSEYLKNLLKNAELIDFSQQKK